MQANGSTVGFPEVASATGTRDRRALVQEALHRGEIVRESNLEILHVAPTDI
jgi:hypothetical protein